MRILTRLQKCIAEESTEDVKKMNPSTAKSYNAMKQKVKKAYKSHQADIDRFLENPVDELESEEERELMLEKQDESDDESDKAQKPAAVLSADVKLTSIDIFTNLDDILQARGKKNTDKVAQIDQLILLLAAAFTPYQKVKLLMSLIPARFDSVLANSGVMSLQMWKAAMDEINSLHDILSANPHITIGHAPEIDEDEDVIKDQKATVGGPVCIHGIITSFVDRLDDEYTKYLQNIDPQSLEYIERLKDEIPLYTTLIRIQKYAENSGISKQQIDLITLRRVEHLYYKPDLLIAALETSCPKSDIKNVLSKLCSTLIKSADERVRARSILCRIYQMALYDKFSEAKDWMLMSRMQETISQLDVGTQILFNRAMVQIGICAFRCGLFSEAHTCLQEIASSGKSRELLGQGISSQRAADKSPEQEKLEKQRQLPFHMHVNLEVVECAYLTSAMLLEVPNMAQHAQDSRRKAISKSFRRMLDYHERQVFTGI